LNDWRPPEDNNPGLWVAVGGLAAIAVMLVVLGLIHVRGLL
jgi:hypothetical protein